MHKTAIQDIQKSNPRAVIIEGYDDCVIGIVNTISGPVLLYSEQKIIQEIMKVHNVSEKEADEAYEKGILNGINQMYAPVFLADYFPSSLGEKISHSKKEAKKT